MAITGKNKKAVKKARKKLGDKKCYVLMVSRNFPNTHAKAGSPTFFTQGICKAIGRMPVYENQKVNANEVKDLLKHFSAKIHTIRLNYELWAARFAEIEAGTAYLSLRYWEAKPYKSKQVEFLQLHNTDGIGIQKLSFPLGVFIDDYDSDVSIKEIAKNDGLSWEDFKEWFDEIPYGSEFVIIHFTDFRYLNSFDKMNYSKQHFNYEKEN